ncbi:hypothetical protein [Croceicoccus sp. YJ47]|uniref:hypothetical protein n=1 Tax=Croceicoccus sp. YJ47 TaxID=2798724 RepID=UPI0019213F3A|nr:hypothetical protein [Croceicoccus sp. YJ47]QQN73965.1 hypothetical protein JD971_14650 [Croceicoccus sp. YJ47]
MTGTPMDHLRKLAVVCLTVMAVGVIAFLFMLVWPTRSVTAEMAGWATAAFLALREFISKIENIVNGPASPLPEENQ